jgi:hypothetical protein
MKITVNGILRSATAEEEAAIRAQAVLDNAPQPARPRIFSKRRFFLALTDAEYDIFAAIEAQQPARDRRAFAEAMELNEGDDDWPQFLGLMHAAYGETRTSEILDAAAQ